MRTTPAGTAKYSATADTPRASEYDSMNPGESSLKKFSAIGKSEPKFEGRHKVTGKAIYTADRALPGIVWGKTLRSPLPHARIARIDTSRARAIPGVLAIVTAADVSEKLFGRQLRDMPVLDRKSTRLNSSHVSESRM